MGESIEIRTCAGIVFGLNGRMDFYVIPTMKGHDYWSTLEEPWKVAVTLACEAFAGGNIGVGAVLTDAEDPLSAPKFSSRSSRSISGAQ